MACIGARVGSAVGTVGVAFNGGRWSLTYLFAVLGPRQLLGQLATADVAVGFRASAIASVGVFY
jgi:hypothetical protein